MRDYATSRQVSLDRRRFAIELAESDRFVETIHRDEFRRETRVSYTIDLFCKSAEHAFELPTFSVPVDWWQSFKERWFPRWALRRWPVARKTLGGGMAKLDVHAIFPELAPLRERHLIIETWDAPKWP